MSEEFLKAASLITGTIQDLGDQQTKAFEELANKLRTSLREISDQQTKAFEGLTLRLSMLEGSSSEKAKASEQLNLRLTRIEGSLDRQSQSQELVALGNKLFANTKAVERTEEALREKKSWQWETFLGVLLMLGTGMIGWFVGNWTGTRHMQESLNTCPKDLDTYERGKYLEMRLEQLSPEGQVLLYQMLQDGGLKPEKLERLKKLANPNPPVNPPGR